MVSFFFKLVFLNSVLLFTGCSPSSEVANKDAKTAKRDMVHSSHHKKWQGYTNGRQADIADFPFIAMVYTHKNDDKARNCVGTIISEKLLVTAATCVCDVKRRKCPLYNIDVFDIYVGMYSEYDPNAEIYKVKKVETHPDFYKQNLRALSLEPPFRGLKHDIAVVYVNDSIKFNDYVNKTTLPNQNVKDKIPMLQKSSTSCTVYYFVIGEYRTLYQAKVYLNGFDICYNKWELHGYTVANDSICTDGHDDCWDENSSAGLLCYVGYERYFVGVKSGTYPYCIYPYYNPPQVFTRVDASLDFINTFTEENHLKSCGDFIHNQQYAQSYGAPLTGVLLFFTSFMKFI